MKKTLRTGKKALSVFMAVLMVMTCWVFFEPTKASAVDSGTYYFRLVADVTNEAEWNTLQWTVYGKNNNGQGTQTTINGPTSYILSQKKNGQEILSGSSTSFPTSFKMYAVHNAASVGRRLEAKLTLYVRGSTSASWQILPVTMSETSRSGFGNHHSITNNSDGSVNIDYENDYGGVAGWGGKDNNLTCTATVKSANKPYVKEVKIDQKSSNLTVPKQDTTYSENNLRAHAIDQYGVVIGSDAYATKYPAVTFSYSDNDGLKAEPQTTAKTYDEWKIGVNNNAKIPDAASKTVTTTVKYKIKNTTIEKSNNYTFTLTDVKYKATFDGNNGEVKSPSSGYVETDYNNTLKVDPLAERTGFTFKGFFGTAFADSYETPKYSGTAIDSNTKVTENTTYYAAWQANQHKTKFEYLVGKADESGYETKTESNDYYYGRKVTVPADVQSTINVGPSTDSSGNKVYDYTYTFMGWDPAIDDPTSLTQPDNDVKYTAQYSTEERTANKTKLNDAIAAANVVVNDRAQYPHYPDGYAEDTVNTFQSALALAQDAAAAKQLLSKQATIDALADELDAAREALALKKFFVLFLDDETGSAVSGGYHYVDYGTNVTVPANPTKDPDANYHYTFNKWLGDVDPNVACNPVTQELTFIADFTKTAHNFTTTTEITPSCNEKGLKRHTCNGCGYTYTEIVDAAGHKMTTDVVTIVEADCLNPGYKAKKCTVCGAIDESTRVNVDALGHDFTGTAETYVEATCTHGGVNKTKCSRCDALNLEKTNKLAHNFGETTTVQPTCTTGGYDKRTCPDCGFVEITNETPALDHDRKTVTQDATCTSAGYTRVYCDRCKEELSFTAIDKLDHHTWVVNDTTDADGWVVEIKETCGTKGVKSRTCSMCNLKETQLIDPAGEHEWDNEHAHNTVEPTCTDKGTKWFTCKKCNATKTEEVAALGHDYVAVVTAPTCLTDGFTTHTCSRCGDSYTDTTVTKLNHTNTDGSSALTPVNIPATCLVGGKIQQHCTICDEDVGAPVDDPNVPATGHKYNADPNGIYECDIKDGVVITPADCETEGLVRVPCLNCGGEEAGVDINGKNEYIDVKTAAEGHDWIEDTDPTKTYPATCTAKGNKHYYCSHDNTHVKDEPIDMIPHNMVVDTDPTKTFSPTCTDKGQTTRVCSYGCGKTEVEEIPALGHDYVLNSHVAPNCQEPGYDLFKCSRDCGVEDKKVYTGADADKVQPHNYEYTVTQPTNDTEGKVEGVCQNMINGVKCGHTIETVIPAGNHVFGEEGKVIDKAPTCKEQGQATFTCTAHVDADGNNTCGFSVTITLDKLAHNYRTITEGVCGKGGHSYSKCIDCGYIDPASNKEIKDHTYVPTIHYPTCDKEGYTTLACKVCGVSIETDFVPALGHDDGYDPENPSLTDANYEAPTCTTRGRWYFECKRPLTDPITGAETGKLCGHRTYVLDTSDKGKPLGHRFTDWKIIEANEAQTYYWKMRECQRCHIKEYELDEHGARNIYYKVEYINPWTVKEYVYDTYTVNGETKTCPTKLAADNYSTEHYKNAVLQRSYVLKGTSETYHSSVAPTFYKTKAFGGYDFGGWGLTAGGNDAVVTGVQDKVENINANTTLYAIRGAGQQKAYHVTFVDQNGTDLTRTMVVVHGDSARWVWDNPTKADDAFYKYEFAGWDYDAINGPVYTDLNVIATYNKVMKQYKIYYHDWNGNIRSYETFTQGAAAKNAPSGNKNDLNNVYRPEDYSYLYNFTGWQLSNGMPISTESICVPNATWKEYDPANESNSELTDAQKGVLHVYPVYETKIIYYPITVIANENEDYYGVPVPEGSTIQILDRNTGYIVGADVIGKDGKAVVNVEYREAGYQIIVNSGDDAGTAFISMEDVLAGGDSATVRIVMQRSEDINHPDKKCGCICHSFLGGIWITFLNLIYSLFGRKVVCCYDMYAVHGDRLHYGK